MRNFNIDLMRMIFAILIVYAHMGLLKMVPETVCGALLVFFFVLTGYFTMAGFEKRRDKGVTMGRFLLSKVMTFLPYLIAACIITFVLQTVLQMEYFDYSLGESLLSSLLAFFADASCLDMFDMPLVIANVAVWYLSGMILGLAVTYPLLSKYGHSFSKYAAPIIGVLCIAVSLRLTGTLFGPYTDIGGLTKGMVESVGMICLGYFAFECVAKLKTMNFTRFGKIVLTVVELGGYILCVAMMFAWADIYTGHLVNHFSREWYELLMCVLMFTSTALTCSGLTYLAFDVSERPTLKKLSAFFATGSLVLYLSNYYQIYFVGKLEKALPFEDKLLDIAFLVAVSFVLVYVGGKVLMWAGKKLRGKMIVQEEEGSARGPWASAPHRPAPLGGASHPPGPSALLHCLVLSTDGRQYRRHRCTLPSRWHRYRMRRRGVLSGHRRASHRPCPCPDIENMIEGGAVEMMWGLAARM